MIYTCGSISHYSLSYSCIISSFRIPDVQCVIVIAQAKPSLTNRGGLALYDVPAKIVDLNVQGSDDVTYLFILFVVIFRCWSLIYLRTLQMQSSWVSIAEIVGSMLI